MRPFLTSVAASGAYWFSRLVNAFRLRHLPSHQKKVRMSRKVLRHLRAMQGDSLDARCLAYVRKIDPLLFEELVLTALEEARGGVIVWRSLRYSGDGGFDGTWWCKGLGRGAVQSKRYQGHISAEHVRDFVRKVGSRGYRHGLFVHTGRTGADALSAARHRRMRFVSGRRLTRLLLEGHLPWEQEGGLD